METINQETIDKILNWDWAGYNDYLEEIREVNDDWAGLLLFDPNERGKYWKDSSILEEAESGDYHKGRSWYLMDEYPGKVEYLEMKTLKEIVRDYKRLKEKELNEKEG